MRRLIVLCGLLATGCNGSATVRQVGVKHAAAVSDHQYAKAFAYSDATLNVMSPDVSTSERAAAQAQRDDDFRHWFADVKSSLAPLTSENALLIFGTLAGFEHVGPPEPDQVVRPLLHEASELLWRQVEALASAGDRAQAVILATAIANVMPALDPRKADATKLRDDAAAFHLAQAREAGDRLFGARMLHAKLAALYGKSEPKLADGGAALVAETALSWTTAVEGDCAMPSSELAGAFPAGPGKAASLAIHVQHCTISDEPLPATREELPYDEQIEVDVPVETTGPEKCTEKSSLPDEVTVIKDGVKQTGFERNTSTSCSSGEKGFHGATRKEMKWVKRTEMVDVANHMFHVRGSGTIKIDIDGKSQSWGFELDAGGGLAKRYDGVHVHSDPLKQPGEADARSSFGQAVIGKAQDAVQDIQTERSKAWLAQALANDAQPLEAEHALFIAGVLAKDPAPLAAYLARRHVPEKVFEAALLDKSLPVLELDEHLAAVPALTSEERNGLADVATENGLESQIRREILFLSFTAGPSQMRATATDAKASGAAASFALTVAAPLTRYGVLGGGFRTGGGIDSALSGVVDIDFFVLGGGHLGALFVTPLLGFGGDFSAGYSKDKPNLSTFQIPPGAYLEYGLRASYALRFLPMTLDAIYTKAFRTSFAALPREKRGDLRLGVEIMHKPIGLTFRYAEYLSDTDGFFATFGPEHRAGQSYWILGGIGW